MPTIVLAPGSPGLSFTWTNDGTTFNAVPASPGVFSSAALARVVFRLGPWYALQPTTGATPAILAISQAAITFRSVRAGELTTAIQDEILLELSRAEAMK